MTGSPIVYNDLISAEDREYWQYLCKKDFKRLEKLVNKSIGEGHFIGDSTDSEEEQQTTTNPTAEEQKQESQDDEENDGFD